MLFSHSVMSTLCNPMDCNTPGFPVLHYLPDCAQIHVHWVSDATQPSHPQLPASPPALNLSQHQGLFQWVSSSHQVAVFAVSSSHQVLELQLQHQSFMTDWSDLLAVQQTLKSLQCPANSEVCSFRALAVQDTLLCVNSLAPGSPRKQLCLLSPASPAGSSSPKRWKTSGWHFMNEWMLKC